MRTIRKKAKVHTRGLAPLRGRCDKGIITVGAVMIPLSISREAGPRGQGDPRPTHGEGPLDPGNAGVVRTNRKKLNPQGPGMIFLTSVRTNPVHHPTSPTTRAHAGH